MDNITCINNQLYLHMKFCEDSTSHIYSNRIPKMDILHLYGVTAIDLELQILSAIDNNDYKLSKRNDIYQFTTKDFAIPLRPEYRSLVHEMEVKTLTHTVLKQERQIKELESRISEMELNSPRYMEMKILRRLRLLEEQVNSLSTDVKSRRRYISSLI